MSPKAEKKDYSYEYICINGVIATPTNAAPSPNPPRRGTNCHHAVKIATAWYTAYNRQYQVQQFGQEHKTSSMQE